MSTMTPITQVLGSGKAILLGMPGAFTPTCNDVHLPGYYSAAEDFAKLGVSNIALITTNDRFVNAQWQSSMEECMGVPAGQAPVVMLSDARGDRRVPRASPARAPQDSTAQRGRKLLASVLHAASSRPLCFKKRCSGAYSWTATLA